MSYASIASHNSQYIHWCKVHDLTISPRGRDASPRPKPRGWPLCGRDPRRLSPRPQGAWSRDSSKIPRSKAYTQINVLPAGTDLEHPVIEQEIERPEPVAIHPTPVYEPSTSSSAPKPTPAPHKEEIHVPQSGAQWEKEAAEAKDEVKEKAKDTKEDVEVKAAETKKEVEQKAGEAKQKAGEIKKDVSKKASELEKAAEKKGEELKAAGKDLKKKAQVSDVQLEGTRSDFRPRSRRPRTSSPRTGSRPRTLSSDRVLSVD